MVCVRKARYAMESRLGLFASMRRTNTSESPTANKMTVTDGEHRKVTGGGKGGVMRVCERPQIEGFCKGATLAFKKVGV